MRKQPRAANSFSKMSREYYLVNIPRTDSAVAASLKRMELAVYNMGIIYKTDLKDFEKAACGIQRPDQELPCI